MNYKFDFAYVPPEELTESVLFEPGECHYLIKTFYTENNDGSELRTREGDKMLKLMLNISDSKGRRGNIFEVLVANTKNAWKIKQLLESVGKPELYNKVASFNPQELLGLQGRAILKTQSNPAYKDKTVVARFLPFDETIKGQVSFKGEKDDDDEIPF